MNSCLICDAIEGDETDSVYECGDCEEYFCASCLNEHAIAEKDFLGEDYTREL